MPKDTETTPSQQGPDVDPIDEIANLLAGEVGEIEPATTEDADSETDDADTEDDSDQDAEDSTDNDEDAAEENDEGDDDRTLSQLIGLDSDQVSVDEESGDLVIEANVDGVKSQLKFKEVLAGYQTQKSNTQRSMAIAKERKDFEEVARQRVDDIQKGLDMNTALTQQLQSELMNEYESTNWDELRVNDPAEYAARQQDQSVRYNQLKGLQDRIQEQRNQHQHKADQETQQHAHQFIAGQREIMLDQNPDWRDPVKLKSAMSEMRTFLTDTYGLDEADIANVIDAKQVAIIHDAMAYRKGAKVAEKKKKKAVPRMQKAKTTPKKRSTKLDRLTKAAKAAKGADRRVAELDAVAELLSGT